MSEPVVLVAGARTPFGTLGGALASVPAPRLGAVAIRAALDKAGLSGEAVDAVQMGIVLPAGIGQAPARQAAAGAGLPWSAGCTSLNKMCGSGMQAILAAHDAILAGSSALAVAGGMESMTNAPHLLRLRASTVKFDAVRAEDHMAQDGLRDPFGGEGHLMGHFAEETATRYQLTRAAQDAYAIESLERARRAAAGFLREEIATVTVESRSGSVQVSADEQPQVANPAKIPLLKPAFRKDGTVTPANSSTISDGAAAVVLAAEGEARRRGLAPLARIRAHATFAREPEWFSLAPVDAIRRVADKAGWPLASVDLFEINEAFAVVAMVAMRDLDLPHARVNVHGGACALGHPIGASGARITLTLARALKAAGLKRGIAAICIGGGEATAIALEAAT